MEDFIVVFFAFMLLIAIVYGFYFVADKKGKKQEKFKL